MESIYAALPQFWRPTFWINWYISNDRTAEFRNHQLIRGRTIDENSIIETWICIREKKAKAEASLLSQRAPSHLLSISSRAMCHKFQELVIHYSKRFEKSSNIMRVCKALYCIISYSASLRSYDAPWTWDMI